MLNKRKELVVSVGVIFILLIASVFIEGDDFFGENKQKLSLKNKNMIKQLSAAEYKELIATNKKVWNLDVRENYEFSQGHIKGAQLVPSTRFEESFEQLKLKKSDKIALYCRSGNRSAFIAEKLSSKGYENIFNLELGIIDWQRSGFPITK